MTTFYLLRHGTKENLEGEPSLSKIGKKQAEKTAQYLQNENIRAIYASPMRRTKQTAEIIAKVLKLSTSIDDRLRERMNWGDVKGQSFDQFMEEWTKTDRDRYYQPNHGNSSFRTGENIKSLMEEAAKKYDNQNILIVTHGGTIGDFLRNILPEKDLPIITNTQLNTKHIEIVECSLTIVKRENNDYSLELVGSFHHLPVLLQ